MRGLGTIAAEAALAAGAALLVGMIFADSRAHACDDRIASGCQPAVQAEASSDAVTAPIPLAARTRQGRTAKTERSRKNRYAFDGRRNRTEPRGEAPAPVASVHPDSMAARRFREFVNPRSFALGTGIELRKPQADAGYFSAEVTDAPMVLAAWTGSEETAPTEGAAILARDETVSSGDSASVPPVALQSSESLEVRQAPSPSGQMSLLRWFFVAWGGILTAASAVRMVVG